MDVGCGDSRTRTNLKETVGLDVRKTVLWWTSSWKKNKQLSQVVDRNRTRRNKALAMRTFGASEQALSKFIRNLPKLRRLA